MTKKKNKFYEFKNITETEADLFIYGEIVHEKSVDWWTGKESQTEIGLMDFKEQLDELGNIKYLNMYINSPGGDVFVASTMISMLKRVKSLGTKIIAYVDGLSASAASFLMMVADEIKIYKNSVVMIHKPMSWAIGNVNDMQQTIDTLNKIEDGVMIPMYMDKAKITEEEIKDLVNKESWLKSSEMAECFNVTMLDEEKIAVAAISSSLFKNYKNIPEFIKNSIINNSTEGNESEEESSESTTKTENIPEEIADGEAKEKSEELQNDSRKKTLKARLSLINYSLIIKNKNLKGDGNNE